MRKYILPLVIGASLFAPTLALAAAQTTEVTIKSLDAKALTITANDGVVYHVPSIAQFVPATAQFAQLKIGEKVKVTWDKAGMLNQASKLEIGN
jgi:hypothetical protein